MKNHQQQSVTKQKETNIKREKELEIKFMYHILNSADQK